MCSFTTTLPFGCPATHRPLRTSRLPVWVPLLGFLLGTSGLRAQQVPDGADSDKQTIQMLVRRVEQLEARVAQLEATSSRLPQGWPNPQSRLRSPSCATRTGGTADAWYGGANGHQQHPASHPRLRQRQTSRQRSERKHHLLRPWPARSLRYFGCSERFKLLSEIVFEADPQNNNFGVDIERLLLRIPKRPV